MKKLHRCFCALFLLVLELSVFQAASAEGYLYLFPKDFPPGDFTAVEAVKEEKTEGNLKLTTDTGKITVWGETLLAAKFPLFDEAKEAPDPEGLQASITAMEKFVQEAPGSSQYLQGLINQRKELQARLQKGTVEVTQTKDDALGRYLGDAYSSEKTYSIEYLEAKLKRGEFFKQQLPEQSAKITEYLVPWAEELKNRNAGLDRFEGTWQSIEAVARKKTEQVDAERKAFFEKGFVFSVPQEAVSQKQVYIFAGIVGVSIIMMVVVLLRGLVGMSHGFGLGVLASLLFGLGGLGFYGWAAWAILQAPAGYAEMDLKPKDKKGTDLEETIPLDELIFRIAKNGDYPELKPPSRYLLEDGSLNLFIKDRLKVVSASTPDTYAVTRRGLKIRVLADRILVFDELSFYNYEIVARYTFFYTSTSNDFAFFKTEACVGNLALPGKLYLHLWQQVLPAVSDVMATSRVLDNYHVSRMERGMIELISNRNPPKPAAPQ